MAECIGGKNVETFVYYVSRIFLYGFAALATSFALLIAALVWSGIFTP